MGKQLSLSLYLFFILLCQPYEGICNTRKIIFTLPLIRRKPLKLQTFDAKVREVHMFAADTGKYLHLSWDTVWTSNSTWLWKRKRFLDWSGRNFPQMLRYWNDDTYRFTKCFLHVAGPSCRQNKLEIVTNLCELLMQLFPCSLLHAINL